jgi:hypothetical protein
MKNYFLLLSCNNNSWRDTQFVAGRAVPPIVQSRLADFARYETEPIPREGFALM